MSFAFSVYLESQCSRVSKIAIKLNRKMNYSLTKSSLLSSLLQNARNKTKLRDIKYGVVF